MTLPKNGWRPLVFIAGGIGITQFLSTTRFVSEKKLDYSITLLYTNRNKEGVAYLGEREEISKKNYNFILKNKYGRLDEDFIQQAVKDSDEPVWYIVGPSPMVAETKSILLHLGVNGDKIYFEEFAGYE